MQVVVVDGGQIEGKKATAFSFLLHFHFAAFHRLISLCSFISVATLLQFIETATANLPNETRLGVSLMKEIN